MSHDHSQLVAMAKGEVEMTQEEGGGGVFGCPPAVTCRSRVIGCYLATRGDQCRKKVYFEKSHIQCNLFNMVQQVFCRVKHKNQFCIIPNEFVPIFYDKKNMQLGIL